MIPYFLVRKIAATRGKSPHFVCFVIKSARGSAEPSLTKRSETKPAASKATAAERRRE